jgi:hypothetical protein
VTVISVANFDFDNPYDFVEIRGRAELGRDDTKELPRELSHKYLGQDPPPEPDEVTRYIARVIADKVNRFVACDDSKLPRGEAAKDVRVAIPAACQASAVCCGGARVAAHVVSGMRR